MKSLFRLTVLLTSLSFGFPALSSASITVQLSPLTGLQQTVGTHALFSATSTGSSAPQYRFDVTPLGGSTSMLRDFASYSSQLDWTPIDENVYTITVTALDPGTGSTSQSSAVYTATSRLTSNAPLISPTAHPLVAMYSAPPCAVGSYVWVSYYPAGNLAGVQTTATKLCVAGKSLNFYLAGMMPWKTYWINQGTSDGVSNQIGATFGYLTPGLPSSISAQIHPVSVLSPADAQTSSVEQFIVDATGVGRNLAGQVVWYLAPPEGALATTSLVRPVDGGTFLTNFAASSDQILREYDVVGNVVHETNIGRLKTLLPNFPLITQFHHEVLRLPNGDTAALINMEKIFNNIQGKTGPVDVVGAGIVVYDTNWQLKWAWSSFDHLDINRAAVLGETCKAGGQPGCPNVYLASIAQDWLHSNALWYANDGNLLMSMRHQDWVIKIKYLDGVGPGDVIWRLGKDGDFNLSASSNDPYPWFSHQHDISLYNNGFLLYDNGNTRQAQFPDAHSRGQFYNIYERAHLAVQVLSVDLGEFSQAVGSAQRLANGNYFFLSGYLGVNGNNVPSRSTAFEIVPSPLPGGTWDYRLQTGGGFLYRSFRLRDFSTYRPLPVY